MAKILRDPDPKNVLEQIFFTVQCDCGSDDMYACEPDGSLMELGRFWLFRCCICGRIWEIIQPGDDPQELEVKLFKYIPMRKKYLNNLRPRKPNKAEKGQLIDWQIKKQNHATERQAVKAQIEDAYIAIFDDYATDSPGYRGKLMLVVWGDPTWYDVYTWDDHGQLRYRLKEYV
jgi:hypothetical protein